MPLWKALSQAMTGTRLQCALPWASFSPTLVLLGPAKTEIDAVPTQLYWKAGTGEYQPVTKYQMYPKHHLYFNNLWCFPMCLQRMASQRQEMQCSLCSIAVGVPGGNSRGTSVMSSWALSWGAGASCWPSSSCCGLPIRGEGDKLGVLPVERLSQMTRTRGPQHRWPQGAWRQPLSQGTTESSFASRAQCGGRPWATPCCLPRMPQKEAVMKTSDFQ